MRNCGNGRSGSATAAEAVQCPWGIGAASGLQNLQSALGVVAILGFAFLISENRRAVPWRPVLVGLVVTFALALADAESAADRDRLRLDQSRRRAHRGGDEGRHRVRVRLYRRRRRCRSSQDAGLGFHPRLPGAAGRAGDQRVVVAVVLLAHHAADRARLCLGAGETLDVGGAVGLSTAANIFVGHVEAPLFIRPYLPHLSRSEMFLVMTGGMARIAGTVFVLYATILTRHSRRGGPHRGRLDAGRACRDPDQPDHGARPGEQHTGGKLDEAKQGANSTMDAIVKGTGAGLELLLNIVAMLIVFVALVYLANAILGLLPDVFGAPLTMQRALGWIMAPVCWLLGIPWSQAVTAGGLMGIKTILTSLSPICSSRRCHRRARSALAADHALRHVRLRQFRLARHHDRGALDHVPGKARRGDLARLEVDRLRHADDVSARRDRRGDDA